MNHIEIDIFISPIAPYNDIIIDVNSNLLLDIIYDTGNFFADAEEVQLYVEHNGVQLVFQTVGSIYQSVSYLVQVVDWYCKHHLETKDVKISFYKD